MFIEGRAVDGVTVEGVVREARVPPTIKVMRPSEKSISKVKEAAEKSGDLDVLSRTDIEVLALALDLNGTVVTNDFAVQNVASALGLKFEPVGREIRKQVRWEWYCPACGRTYNRKGECEYCGTPLKRRPKGREKLHGKTGG